MKPDYQGTYWDNLLVLGIPVVDNQHKNLVRIINKLFTVSDESGKTTNRIFIETAHEALEYMRNHFITEEKIMLIIKYDKFLDHKKHHEDYLRNTNTEISLLSGNKNIVTERFAYFFEDLVRSDISMHDKEMSDCILNMSDFGKFGMIFS